MDLHIGCLEVEGCGSDKEQKSWKTLPKTEKT
jgi:hypothetical protein